MNKFILKYQSISQNGSIHLKWGSDGDTLSIYPKVDGSGYSVYVYQDWVPIGNFRLAKGISLCKAIAKCKAFLALHFA